MADPYLDQDINIANYMDYAQEVPNSAAGLPALNLQPLTMNGQVVQIYDVQNGVQAEAFITTPSAGQKHIIIGYGGIGFDPSNGQVTSSLYSNPQSATGSPGDLFTGAQFQNGIAVLAGQTPSGAVASATNFANQVIGDAQTLGLTQNDVTLTGHNLGGTLAEYVASNTGLGGVSYGAAGIVNGASQSATNFTNYVEGGDLFGNYAIDNGDPLGPLVQSGNITHYGQVQQIGSYSGSGSNQATMSVNAANAYSGSGAATKSLFADGVLINNNMATYAGDLNANPNTFTDFGSFASPMDINNAPITPVAPTPTNLPNNPIVYQPTTTVPLPSAQVVNQDVNLCNYMYSPRTGDFPTGLSNLGLTPLVNNGSIVQVYNEQAGVAAEAFETTGSGNPQIVIAYEGTNPYGANTGTFTGGQLLDDASFFAGKPAAACALASQNFANQVLTIAGNVGISSSQVSLTGHSLGAAEAEYAAEATGLSGVTFGTPGIAITGNLPPSNLTNFVDYGDPVGNFGFDNGNPLGNFVTSPDIAHYGGVTLIGATSPGAADAQTNLTTTATDFFDPTNADYKDLSVALSEANLANDFQYHHLSSYVTSLNNTYPQYDKSIALVCYCTGTAIRTADDDRAVETLRAGDLVVTAAGETRAVKWIGHRAIDCRKHPQASEMWPVRIAAHAFGENRPSRDLFVSPGHAICVDVLGEVLIPAGALVNGSTIRQVEVDEVTYWHVELDSHDILLAENLACESYLDMGNRGFFKEADVVDLAAGPDVPPAARTHADFCRPFHADGALVAFVRERLDARAAALGWRLSDAEPWAGVHVLADGVRVEPDVRGLAARFVIPAATQNVWLVSPAASPHEIGMSADGRRLGLNIAEMRVGADWDTRSVALDDPLLCAGFHVAEGAADALHRWTAGRARLPAALWADATSGADLTLILRLCSGSAALPRWVKPVAGAGERDDVLAA